MGVTCNSQPARTTGAAAYLVKYFIFIAVFILLFILFARTGYVMVNEDSSWFPKLVPDKTALQSALPDERPVIVLDAGHGGADGGAQGVTGVLEKDLNLSLTLKIAEILRIYDLRVELTREDDSLLGSQLSGSAKRNDLTRRVQYARSFENAVFVSVHMNKFAIEKYCGLQTFYSPNNPLSEALAISVQSAVKKHIQPQNNREIKKAGKSIFVLDRLEIPAILIECGFLSNREEERLLSEENYQNRLALVISGALINCLSLI